MCEKKISVNKDVSETANNTGEPIHNNNWFTTFHIICIILSMLSFVADILSDFALAAKYWHGDNLVWSLSTFLLILIPTILIQLFSMRWHLMDEAVSLWHWIAHLCLFGLLHRYIILLKMIFNGRNSKSSNEIQKIYIQHSDVFMLHLFESFLEAAPQFLLQSYIMTTMNNYWQIFAVLSMVASICSLYCGIVGYMKALRMARENTFHAKKINNGISVILQIIWRCSMLAARLAALFMFSIAFKHWIFLLLSVHWFLMVIWIVQQKTDFCPSQSEEILYNCIVGVIYCFCFFNLRVGQARYRMIIFYTFMVSQNILCLLLFLFIAPGSMRKDIAITASVIIIGGTFLGISCMLIYYRWLHPSGPLQWWNNNAQPQTSPQTNNPEAPIDNTINSDIANVTTVRWTNPRSLKTTWQTSPDMSCTKNETSSASIENPPLDTDCTDKKHLLDHWGCNAGTSALAAQNDNSVNVTGIEFYSITNSPEKNNLTLSVCSNTPRELLKDNNVQKNKRRGICSPTELGVKFKNIEQNVPNSDINKEMTAQKRRGICSSGQLKEELGDHHQNNFVDNIHSVSYEEDEDACNGKTSSEFYNLDLDLSFSDINSSDITEFNENIVQKLCLSTLKNIKNVHQDADIRNIQKIALDILKELYSKGGIKDEQDLESELSSTIGRDLETPSEALSAHDYENICAVNIAREAWGLRSWKACSDMGRSPPPPPPPPQHRPLPPSPHQQYIRTVAYELAKCEETNCQLMKSRDYHQEPEPVFLAKPFVDINDSSFPITQLEPILEEIDDIIDNSGSMRRRQRHSSESALVATIDEIRNDTVTDSPRNVYHRENWDSPCLNIDNDFKEQVCKPSSLRKSLWTNIDGQESEESMKQIHYSENTKTNDSNKKRVTISDNPCIINDIVDLKIAAVQTKTVCNAVHNRYDNGGSIMKTSKPYLNKRSCNHPQAHLQKKTLNKNSQKMQINNSPAINITDINQQDVVHGSLQNLIVSTDKDRNTKVTNEISNAGKQRNSNTNRPRRRFSLLREKFEPKTAHSDEEMLFQSLESVKSLSHNDLNITSSQSCLKNNIVLVNQEPKCDKENFTPKDKLPHLSDDGVILSLAPCSLDSDTNLALKDKPTTFLKQVLGPPKINNWARRNISEYVN